MKTHRKIILIIGASIALLCSIIYLLPVMYKVQRSIIIKGDKEIIFSLISDFHYWRLWSPWSEAFYPKIIIEIKGRQGVSGTRYRWVEDELGVLTISEVVKNQSFSYLLQINAEPRYSNGRILIEKQGSLNKVTWIYDRDLAYNPIARIKTLIRDLKMGRYFGKGLKKLKQVAESKAGWLKIVEKDYDKQLVLFICDSIYNDIYQEGCQKYLHEINDYFFEINKACIKYYSIRSNFIPVLQYDDELVSFFVQYLKRDTITSKIVINIGVFIKDTRYYENPIIFPKAVKGRVQIGYLPLQRVIMAIDCPHDEFWLTYRTLMQYSKERGFYTFGPPREEFISYQEGSNILLPL